MSFALFRHHHDDIADATYCYALIKPPIEDFGLANILEVSPKILQFFTFQLTQNGRGPRKLIADCDR